MESEQLMLELKIVDESLARIQKRIDKLQQDKSNLEDKKALLVSQIESLHELRDLQDIVSDWESKSFPWTQNLWNILNSVFKIESFRPLQLSCINALLSKRDVMLIMPTGGGKSLCYQLPAVVNNGFTLVISPLVSLMEDQLMSVKRLGIDSAMLNSDSSRSHVSHVHSCMTDKSNASLKLVYVTPEKIAKSKQFMSKLEKAYGLGRLSLIVIDEVHCASQWGHDFRPDYKILGILKRQFPETPLLGLTATATSKVFSDCKNILNLSSCLVFKASYNRPNLMYEVHDKGSSHKEQMDIMIGLIKKRFKQESGIVYCFSQKDAEQVCIGLHTGGISATCYHAGMVASDRTRAHNNWCDGKMQVIVATVAFGMGIDKSNVRFVIHHSLSKSMENYYQESGRAGRDGEPATCILYYKLADVFRQSTMASKDYTSLSNLYPMVQYCINSVKCRRALVAKHFGDTWKPNDCNKMCDICRVKSSNEGNTDDDHDDDDDIVVEDVTSICQGFIDVLDNKSKSLTGLMLLEKWKNSSIASTQFSPASRPSIVKLEKVLAHCLLNNILKESFHYTPYNTVSYIVPDRSATAVRIGDLTVSMERLRSVSEFNTSAVSTSSAPLQSSSIPSTSKQSTSSPLNTSSTVKLSSTSKSPSSSTSLSHTKHSSTSTPVTSTPVTSKPKGTPLRSKLSVNKPRTTFTPLTNDSSNKKSSNATPAPNTKNLIRKRTSLSRTFIEDSDDDIDDFETPKKIKKINLLSLRKRNSKGKSRESLPPVASDDVICINSTDSDS